MGIPTHYIKKRDLLHSPGSSPAVLSRTAQEFLALERFSDALDFFEKARDQDGIAEIKRIALERGDTFLLARLDRLDRTLITREEWDAAAQQAVAAQRPSMAAFVTRRFAPPAGPASAVAKVAERPGETPVSEI